MVCSVTVRVRERDVTTATRWVGPIGGLAATKGSLADKAGSRESTTALGLSFGLSPRPRSVSLAWCRVSPCKGSAWRADGCVKFRSVR